MMVGMSDGLVTFLLARISEDEEVALLPAPGDFEWRYDDRTETQWHTARCGYEMLEMLYPCECDVRARVLAECEAKRHLLDEARVWGDGCVAVMARYMAEPYANHPDYREEWRP